MAKIVYMSDSPVLSTGYGRVGRVLCDSFIKAGHEVVAIGWGTSGVPHDLPYEILPCSNEDRFGEDVLADVIRKWKPDILFTLGDPWMTDFIPSMEERRAVTWVSYFPIDGYPVPTVWHDWIKNTDVPVVFSRFSQDLVTPIIGRKPTLIYHGVDTNIFKPLDRAEIKESYEATDLFVVGTVARNQPRKNLPALVKAFSIFANKKDDVALFMHCQVRDVGWNIDELVTRFGLQDKAFTTAGFAAMKGVPDEELAKIYNLFDIFVLPTMAEGFGLPILEAQSCGVPVLVTDFSACSELVVDRQELLKVKDTLIMGRNIEQAIVDVDDIVRKLDYFYFDWKRNKGNKAKQLGEKGRKFAQTLDWDIITKDFNKLIANVEANTKNRDKTIFPSFYKI